MNEEYQDNNIVCPFCEAEIRFIEKCDKCGKSLSLDKMTARDFIGISAGIKKRREITQADIIFNGAI